MDFGLVIVIISGVGGVLGIVIAGIRHEEFKLKMQLAASAADAGATSLETEVARLKDRVIVLEKLVTNDDRRLANDIEHLRSGDRAGLPV